MSINNKQQLLFDICVKKKRQAYKISNTSSLTRLSLTIAVNTERLVTFNKFIRQPCRPIHLDLEWKANECKHSIFFDSPVQRYYSEIGRSKMQCDDIEIQVIYV